MSRRPELILPQPYDQLMTEPDMAAHAHLQSITLAEFATRKESAKTVTTDLADGTRMQHVSYRYHDETDPTEATVVLATYGNGHNMYSHIHEETAQALADQRRQTLLFPNGGDAYSFTEQQKEKPIEALADKVLETVAAAGITRVFIDGYSQGAMVGAAMAERNDGSIQIAGAHLGDPVVKKGRSAKQLKSDYIGGNPVRSLHSLFHAVQDAAIPALTESQNASWSRIVPWARGALSYNSAGSSPENTALHTGLAEADFAGYLESAQSQDRLPTRLIVARMALSQICRPELSASLEELGLIRHERVVPAYGHEGADNVVLRALLAREATRNHAIVIPSRD